VPPLVNALAAPDALGNTYTLAGECLTARELAEACIRVFGSRSRIVQVPEPLVAALSVAARVLPLPLYPDQLARLRAPKPEPSPDPEELGFRPRPLEDGLRAFV
jgi:uncharacterized protein YbjT (DUF2867 family)